MAEPLSVTLNEAGYVVGQSSATINRAVDRGLIRATLQRRGNARLRKVGAPELRYLAIADQIAKDLTPAARKRVYEAIRRLPPAVHRVSLGVLQLDFAGIDRHIAERLGDLAAMRSLVDETTPEPTVKHTSIPVHSVAALARHRSPAEILHAYPSLTPAQIDAAVAYARIYPRIGRPLPDRSFKALLGDLAEAGLWDLEPGPTPLVPRPMR